MRILLAFVLFISQANAQVNRSVTGGLTPNLVGAETNFVLNSGAEDDIYNITQSASITSRTTTTPLFGKASFVIDATSSGQTVKFNTATYTDGVEGNCLATMWVEGDASLYKVYVEDGSGNKLTTDLQLSNYTQARPVPINYVCTAGAKPVIESTSASAASIEVDNVTSGLATNLGTVNQAVVLGSITYPTTANCAWSTTTTIGNYSADTDCGTPTVTGQATAPGTKIPAIVFPNGIPAGQIVLTASANFDKPDASNYACRYRFNDGTNSTSQLVVYDSAGNATGGHLVGSINYSSNQSGPVTINIQGGSTTSLPCNISASGNSDSLTITVQHFPSQSQQVVSQNSQGWFVAANIVGANPGLGVADITTYTEITNASLTMTPKSGSAPVGITCSSTNAAATPTTGTSTCSAGNESVGAAFNPPDVGYYRVCAQFTTLFSTSTSATAAAAFQLIETPTNAQTNNQLGGGIQSGVNSIASSNPSYPFDVCGVFYFGSTSTKAVRLMAEQDITNTAESILQMDGAATLGQRDLFITVEKVSSGQNNPYTIGSVQSGSTGIESIIRFKFGGSTETTACNSTPCTIYRQSGGVSSVSRSGTGAYTMNFSPGIFSAPPTCVANATVPGISYAFTNTTNTTCSATACNFELVNSSSAAADGAASVICMGPK